MPSALVEPKARDSKYGSNVAQYLVDLHDNKATFDFCGGMMFQLVLSDKLRSHLQQQQPVIHEEARMQQIAGYSRSSHADNSRIFHGRELRRVPNAAGGMEFVLQLSLANADDPEGWTHAEVQGYDGWGHDSGRTWRDGERYEKEGFRNFKSKFGPDAFGLHHRFYLHYDRSNRIWLSAEDGCEGTPGSSTPSFNGFGSLFGF